jgi:nitrite reductase/ring-hydroxylating ferredoxin subunit
MSDDSNRAERWREDFPIAWDVDHYLTRRELAKFLTLGSALLVGATGALVAVGHSGFQEPRGELRIASAAALAPGGSMLFRYPTEQDPCILVRGKDGVLRAFSQVCTHLSCAVVHVPEDDELMCPCHRGFFDASDGRPVAGPPTRRLPRIRLQQRGDDVFAVGVEV